MRLKNKVAFITGAVRGLGRATALSFAREGASVAVCDISDSDSGLGDEIEKAGARYAYFPCDVTKSDQVNEVVKAISAKLGTVDILINNAGITQDATLAKMTEEQWNAVIGVNLSGVFLCTKAVVPGMIEKKAGKIINLSSIVGLYGNFGQTNYAATKSGVIGMTKTWARELGPKGINVNAVAPGFIATEMVKKMPQDVLDGMKQRTPMRRIGEPQDIANACVFLASREADFINGAVLSVDGGLVL
jgi:3-oxoacyl-[acyl-carrier protein] reductase